MEASKETLELMRSRSRLVLAVHFDKECNIMLKTRRGSESELLCPQQTG